MQNDYRASQDRDIDLKGTHLLGKNLALAVSGSVAAIRAFDIARELRRYGANVEVYPTEEALRFIGVDSLEWASGNKAVMNLTSEAEHTKDYDAYLVAPATLDIINAIAEGRGDTPAKTTLAAGFGKHYEDGTPFLIAPAMEHKLWSNPPLKRNMEYLKSEGVKIIEPKMTYGKANLADVNKIVAYTIRELSNSNLRGKKIVVNAGPVASKWDDIRRLTNSATGALGIEIAKELYLRGADVKLIYGDGKLPVPEWIDKTDVIFYDQMYDAVMKETEDADLFIASAAIPDFLIKGASEGKIKSGESITIELEPSAKIIAYVRKERTSLAMLTYKLEETKNQAIATGKERLGDYELVFVNSIEELDNLPNGMHLGYFMDRNDNITKAEGTKTDVAKSTVDGIEKYYSELESLPVEA